MVESTGLENRHTLIAYLGFKSLSLRHYYVERQDFLVLPFFVFIFCLAAHLPCLPMFSVAGPRANEQSVSLSILANVHRNTQ